MNINIRRKTVLKSLILSFFALASIYIYFVGMLISQNALRQNLSQTLEKASTSGVQLESVLVKKNEEKNLDYFLAAGYEKSKNLEVLRKTSNVAANY